jgi:hypothetical protein
VIGSEEGSLEWVQIADLPNLPVVEDLLTLLPMVTAHEVGDPLIIGKYQYVDDKLKMSFV